MLDRRDQLELLAFIEGELDAQQAAALRQRLSAEPRVLVMLDRMREDRFALRSVPEADLPRDFLALLEPVLARQMLIESAPPPMPVMTKRPGEFRRQYRRQHRRIRWSRVALVAMLFIALIAGVWAAVNGIVRSNLNDRGTLAENTEAAKPAKSSTGETLIASNMPVSGPIHHYLPLQVEFDWPRVAQSQPPDPAPPREAQIDSGPATVVMAEFAIVVNARDAAIAEKALIASAAQSHSQAAVVRNFSYAEAQRLSEQWRVANGPASESADRRMASVDRAPAGPAPRLDSSTLAQRVREQLRSAAPATRPADAGDPASAQLAGSKDRAPSLEQQLDFASRGATHSISVPLRDLQRLMQQLSQANGVTTALRLLPNATDAAHTSTINPVQPLSLWLSETPRVRQSIQRLQQMNPDPIVVVPIIVQSDRESPKR